jgi:hypothetical protein
MFNLTLLGPLDWAHWSFGAALITDHAAGGTRLGALAGKNLQSYNAYQLHFEWTNAASPAPSIGSSPAGVFEATNAAEFSLPASATPARNTMHVYIATWNADGEVAASMPGAATPAPQSAHGDNTQTLYYVVPIVFASPTPAQVTFTFRMTADKGGGTISMLAASLSPN